MQILQILALAAMAVVASQHLSGPEVVAVRRVTGGGSIDVADYGRIRLAGIRAPKTGNRGTDGEPFGREARDRLEGLVGHRYVHLVFPAATSRASAYVF